MNTRNKKKRGVMTIRRRKRQRLTSRRKRGIDRGEMRDFLVGLNKEVNRNITRLNKQVGEVKKLFMKYEEPYCEISQDHKNFFINVKLPKVYKKDIILRIDSNRVEIKGVRKNRQNNTVKVGGFYRSVEMPTDVRPERARAVFRNDSLRIRIPKERKKKLVFKER